MGGTQFVKGRSGRMNRGESKSDAWTTPEDCAISTMAKKEAHMQRHSKWENMVDKELKIDVDNMRRRGMGEEQGWEVRCAAISLQR